jgi:hypothetical protein
LRVPRTMTIQAIIHGFADGRTSAPIRRLSGEGNVLSWRSEDARRWAVPEWSSFGLRPSLLEADRPTPQRPIPGFRRKG